jgi:hypothetical protein
MVTSGKKGKTIHSEAMEVINHPNHQFKEAAADESLILHISHADKRTEK